MSLWLAPYWLTSLHKGGRRGCCLIRAHLKSLEDIWFLCCCCFNWLYFSLTDNCKGSKADNKTVCLRRSSLQVLFKTKFPNKLCFELYVSNAFGSRRNTLSLLINCACSKYHHRPSPFPVKQLKAIATAQIWKKTVPCILTVVYMLNINLFSRKPGKSVDQSERAIYKSAISNYKRTTALHQGWQWAFH